MKKVRAWYLHGIDYSDAPASLAELRKSASVTDVTHDELLATQKWEHLLQGNKSELAPGWTYLGDLADTRRGIATGANAFFLVSKARLDSIGIRPELLLPCVGRAVDVEHFDFTMRDFDGLVDGGTPTFLLNLRGDLTASEAAYVRVGEEEGLVRRHLLANRRPWYSMEQREVAPIWAAVFGRGDLKFVLNSSGVRSLTNFHCVYPKIRDPDFLKALVFCLNTPVVRAKSRLQTRVYGGGLAKFEPKDVKALAVPDLRFVGKKMVEALASRFCLLDSLSRTGKLAEHQLTEWDSLVVEAGDEAASKAVSL